MASPATGRNETKRHMSADVPERNHPLGQRHLDLIEAAWTQGQWVLGKAPRDNRQSQRVKPHQSSSERVDRERRAPSQQHATAYGGGFQRALALPGDDRVYNVKNSPH